MGTREFKTSGVRPRPKTYAYVTVRRTGHGQLCFLIIIIKKYFCMIKVSRKKKQWILKKTSLVIAKDQVTWFALPIRASFPRLGLALLGIVFLLPVHWTCTFHSTYTSTPLCAHVIDFLASSFTPLCLSIEGYAWFRSGTSEGCCTRSSALQSVLPF